MKIAVISGPTFFQKFNTTTSDKQAFLVNALVLQFLSYKIGNV